MIKQLRKYDVQTTPFIATKSWELLNVQHQDLVLLEPYSASVPIDDTFVALEFIDYNYDNPYGILNTACNLALEQQTYDPVIYEEGISGSGLFYPDDSKNPNGTYKRLVYQQILRAFYNNYHNPFQIFGLENIDFQTSGMQKYLCNYFKIFRLPQEKFGDKIKEGTVLFVDNSFDDNYVVKDDYKGNLIAAPNLFSRTQEVRHIENEIVDLVSGNTCENPIVTPPIPSGLFTMTASLTASSTTFTDNGYLVTYQSPPYTMSLIWTDPFNNENGFYLYMATQLDTGSAWGPSNYAGTVGPNTTTMQIYYNLPMVSASFYAVAWNSLGVSGPSTTASINITASYTEIP